MVDLQDQVKLFAEVKKLTSDENGHKVLTASHGLFLKELHLYLAEMAKSKMTYSLIKKL